MGESMRIAAPSQAPRIALAPELLAVAQPDVAAQVTATAEAFARAGATVTEIKLPASYAGLHAAGQVVLEAEAAAFHADMFARHAADYAPGIRGTVTAGLAHPATAYIVANRARLLFRTEVMPLLAAHDALLSPVAPSPAPAGLGSTGDPVTVCTLELGGSASRDVAERTQRWPPPARGPAGPGGGGGCPPAQRGPLG